MLSRMSRTTARCVSTRREIDPGNSRKYGVTPYATTGNTGTPSGSAASDGDVLGENAIDRES
jgi:hypothetical protein